MNAVMTGSMVLVSAFVALERLDHEREPCLVGEQAHGDLRFQAAFLGEPGRAEPVAAVGLEVQRGHVIQHQAGRTQLGVRGAGRGQLLPPRQRGIRRQAAVERGIRRRGRPGLGQDPQRVPLAGRLDDPREDQLPEHLIIRGGLTEAEHVIGTAQRIQQVSHPRGGDLQRPARSPAGQAQVELALIRQL
jgi:hypothetical protein